MKNFFLNNKLAYVVGGSGQIGKEIVKIFSDAGGKKGVLMVHEKLKGLLKI